MTTKVSTHGPDGEILPMTHRHKATRRLFRVVFGEVPHLILGATVRFYVLADEQGAVSVILADFFSRDTFEYIPGGQ